MTSATTRAGLDRSFTSARKGSSSKLQNLARSASGPLVDKSEASGDAQEVTQPADHVRMLLLVRSCQMHQIVAACYEPISCADGVHVSLNLIHCIWLLPHILEHLLRMMKSWYDEVMHCYRSMQYLQSPAHARGDGSSFTWQHHANAAPMNVSHSPVETHKVECLVACYRPRLLGIMSSLPIVLCQTFSWAYQRFFFMFKCEV